MRKLKKPDGILIVNKEKGMTSFDVVFRVRRLFGIKKVGHTGTLDPDAEGVLPVCIGRATKCVDMMTGMTKTYEARIRLGVVTDTQDIWGTILEEHPVTVSENDLRAAIMSFEGDSMQIPPMYSAVKVRGKKLVDLARKGVSIDRKPRPVTFSDIRISSVEMPEAVFEVTCSKGAYIRTLCHDIGRSLGCGAALAALKRKRVGPFALTEAKTIGEIRAILEKDLAATGAAVPSGEVLKSLLIPTDAVFSDAPPFYSGSSKQDAFLLNGRDMAVKADVPDGTRCRVYLTDGSFVGLYRYRAGEEKLKLEKFFYDLSDGSN